MTGKLKDCFTLHSLMHGLFGLGLGLLLATLFAGLRLTWLAVALMVVAVAVDATRKN